ncbi:unnamed protein product [Polarella glacialis]|uniref:RING-type domain-containing protein n=1 Tax=Polarella glacialis TaxID=89957 RepID=A0A813JUX6_POLGL|nr:unnamed protein product [Polarella glacialis]
MLQQFSCLKVRKLLTDVRHNFRLLLLMAVFTLSLGELFFVVFFTLPLTQLWPAKEMLFMASAAAAILAVTLRLGQVSLQLINKVNGHNTSAAPQLLGSFGGKLLTAAMAGSQVAWSMLLALFVVPRFALLLWTSAALDLLLWLLLWSTALLGSPRQRSAEVATSRNADVEEYQIPSWRLWQQEDGTHYGQAVEFKHFTWPSRGTRASGVQTRGFEVNTCMVCLADFVSGELLSSLPCGHIFHTACIANWQQHSRLNNTNNSSNHSVCPCRCTTSQPLVMLLLFLLLFLLLLLLLLLLLFLLLCLLLLVFLLLLLWSLLGSSSELSSTS